MKTESQHMSQYNSDDFSNDRKTVFFGGILNFSEIIFTVIHFIDMFIESFHVQSILRDIKSYLKAKPKKFADSRVRLHQPLHTNT